MFKKLNSNLKYLYKRYWSDNRPSIWFVEAPTNSMGGGHTHYELLRFGGPGTTKVRPWPLENFRLTTAKHQNETKQFLAKQGLELITDEWFKTA